jgi:hypothetical protein
MRCIDMIRGADSCFVMVDYLLMCLTVPYLFTLVEARSYGEICRYVSNGSLKYKYDTW